MQDQLKALLRLTVQDPRAAAAGLMADKNARANALWLAVLVVVLGVLAASVQVLILPGRTDGMVVGLLNNPILFVIIQFMLLMISVIGIHVVGRMFGGRGSFDQALIISVWLQFFTLLVQIALVPIALVASSLAALLTAASYIYFIWLMVNFIAELHGFRSLWRVLGGIIAASFAASFVILFVLGFLGVSVEGV